MDVREAYEGYSRPVSKVLLVDGATQVKMRIIAVEHRSIPVYIMLQFQTQSFEDFKTCFA